MIEGAAEHYTNPNVGARSINSAIKHYKVYGVKAINNDGEIYLIKEDR